MSPQTNRLRTHHRLGPVVIRVGSKNLAPWGFPRVQIGGLSLWSWSSNGELHLIAHHPRRSITWLWYVAIGRRSAQFGRANIKRLREFHRAGSPYVTPPSWLDHFVRRDARRRGQWHDYFRLPFGFTLIVGHQDEMLRRVNRVLPPGQFHPDWRERVGRDQCPVCDGSLDTGWECTECGFDAYLIAQTEGLRPNA